MQGTSLRGDSWATVANAGSPGRSRSSRKTIAQGVPGDFGGPVLSLRASFSLARVAVGASCTRHSLRPLFEEGHRIARLGRKARRGDENALFVRCHRPPCAQLRTWGGRSSIPEASQLNSTVSGILDAPPSRGMTAEIADERSRNVFTPSPAPAPDPRSNRPHAPAPSKTE